MQCGEECSAWESTVGSEREMRGDGWKREEWCVHSIMRVEMRGREGEGRESVHHESNSLSSLLLLFLSSHIIMRPTRTPNNRIPLPTLLLSPHSLLSTSTLLIKPSHPQTKENKARITHRHTWTTATPLRRVGHHHLPRFPTTLFLKN